MFPDTKLNEYRLQMDAAAATEGIKKLRADDVKTGAFQGYKIE